jgi:guanine deaminase
MTQQQQWMREAVRLSRQTMIDNAGAPFGAVIVRNGGIIGSGQNIAPSTSDPTAHAEVVAIRDACKRAGSMHLEGAEIYASGEPCPMCLTAIYWAKIERIYFAISCSEAATFGFDDQFLYREFAKPPSERLIPATQIADDQAIPVFQDWDKRTDKLGY